MTTDLVDHVLQEVARRNEQFKPITVNKLIELEIDPGTLLALDKNDISLAQLRQDKDKYLKELTRDNVQLLVNKIWELPTERKDEDIVATLPDPTYVLPREKPVPKVTMTKWEEFALEKGIRKTKKIKKKWDDVLKEWVPTYGFKRRLAEKKHQWMLPVPANANPMEDQFAKKVIAKKERVAKNEYQRLRNIAKSNKTKIPSVGVMPHESVLSSRQLREAADVAVVSTASIGKYQPNLALEKKVRQSKKRKLPGQEKEKLGPLKPTEEKQRNLDLYTAVSNKKPKVNMEKVYSRLATLQARSESKR
uniref:Ribosome biogenesis regulatory protein n=1 Tax=Cacopsylla melanoneura TaxID=428564 RepID=A0A8D8XRI6_9HEMI